MVEKKRPMTKTQIITHMAGRLELSKKAINTFFDEFTSLAYTQTKKSGSFVLPGFGKLVVSKRKARKGRNPATGETIKIPAKTVVKMRLAKACKDSIVPAKKK